MSEEEAVSAIDELLVGEQSIPGKLAMKEGIDEEAVSRLERAIETLIPIYKVRKDVSKKVAGAFLDLTADFDRTMPLYSPEQQVRIEDLKLHIISLGYDLFES
jgi:hypothetical protein